MFFLIVFIAGAGGAIGHFLLSLLMARCWYWPYAIGVVALHGLSYTALIHLPIAVGQDGDQRFDDLLVAGFLSLSWLVVLVGGILGAATRGILDLNTRSNLRRKVL